MSQTLQRPHRLNALPQLRRPCRRHRWPFLAQRAQSVHGTVYQSLLPKRGNAYPGDRVRGEREIVSRPCQGGRGFGGEETIGCAAMDQLALERLDEKYAFRLVM